MEDRGTHVLPALASATPLSGIRQRWTLEDIPWHEVDHEAIEGDELLFYLVVTASFIETATDTYARNLTRHFDGDPQVTAWLEQRWQPEELQHGRALRCYVQVVWPGLDWHDVYRRFFSEFSAKCRDDGLEATHCLEAVSRCMVEMGTASYYTTLNRLSPEPVLELLAGLIREDEVRHYKYFYRFFLHYREREGMGRLRILAAILRRLRMMDVGDSSIALKHAYLARYPRASFDRKVYRDIQARIRGLMQRDFPLHMSMKMALKPLDLSPRTQQAVLSSLTFLSRRLLHSPAGGTLRRLNTSLS
jgi:hypothetical protein